MIRHRSVGARGRVVRRTGLQLVVGAAFGWLAGLLRAPRAGK